MEPGATALHDDQLAVVAQSFDISLYRENLAKGKNVLAIHGLNYEKNSSDMLIVAELVYASGEGDGTALPVCEPPVERTPESILLSGRLAGHQPDSKVLVWEKQTPVQAKKWEYSKEIKPGESGRLQHLVDGLAAGAELFYRVYVDSHMASPGRWTHSGRQPWPKGFWLRAGQLSG